MNASKRPYARRVVCDAFACRGIGVVGFCMLVLAVLSLIVNTSLEATISCSDVVHRRMVPSVGGVGKDGRCRWKHGSKEEHAV